MHTFDLTMDRITKVEGSAALELRVKDNKVQHVHFKITEYKRFFTQAMQGKPIVALPQLLARICGTCSNAHLLCSIEACEHALGIKPTEQTLLLRALTMHGLNIRDHALHLYLFSMPDIFGKDAFLDFDESDPVQHQMLHDGFAVKSAGNYLATLIAGRSVHAVHPTIGGFAHFPDKAGVKEAIRRLEEVRPAVLRLISIFDEAPFHFDRKTSFMALDSDKYRYLNGCINTGTGECIPEQYFREHLEQVVLPYSQAVAYQVEGQAYMVGALARMNLSKEKLHPRTKTEIAGILERFPSTDIYHNNLAQAIEILHSVDDSIDILSTHEIVPEPPVKAPYREAVGVGVIEAPRGSLYHKVEVDARGMVKEGEIVVPTGQNQINIQEDVWRLVEEMLPRNVARDYMVHEIEKLIRAYDPCMSCAAHFLKVKWSEG